MKLLKIDTIKHASVLIHVYISNIPHVCWSEASVMLRCRGTGTNRQRAISSGPLPVIGVIFHDIVGFHTIVKH